MYSEITEWEARGDGLRQAKRFGEALEAYRTALRQCFQWTHEPAACDGIREKIWAVQIEECQGYAAVTKAGGPIDAATRDMMNCCHTPDVLELAAARLAACGAREEADRLIEVALRNGVRASGEFLDRLAEDSPDDFAETLRALATQVRGGSVTASSGSAPLRAKAAAAATTAAHPQD